MGKVKYKISARATILLGREGVSKADGAIVELIKKQHTMPMLRSALYA